ncbi:hypothetical protein F2Q68_00044066 [Brassica cretica]|uniref:Uncharacterized protein n=1 Tax=Brassica cretica TaxID=69181 RepID=A0A8S9LVD6_BRACR|nr:hypothetical protein F2Q68_00044066 [Brassica cretica]
MVEYLMGGRVADYQIALVRTMKQDVVASSWEYLCQGKDEVLQYMKPVHASRQVEHEVDRPSTRCCDACDQAMRPDMWMDVVSPCMEPDHASRQVEGVVSLCITWRRFCSSEERSVLVETSSRPVWTWVYLRRSRKGSDRRSRVWGQGHGQPKTLANAECLDDIAKLWIVSVASDLVPGGFKEIPYSLDREDSDRRGHGLWLSEHLALDCLGWDSEGLYLLVRDCNSLSNARLLTTHSLLFQVTSSELVEVAGG